MTGAMLGQTKETKEDNENEDELEARNTKKIKGWDQVSPTLSPLPIDSSNLVGERIAKEKEDGGNHGRDVQIGNMAYKDMMLGVKKQNIGKENESEKENELLEEEMEGLEGMKVKEHIEDIYDCP